ncbi:MAG: YfhO family protein [Elusimicrobia bacterium]|nr:YfhO family protein [Elusimicrobiota bacterium]
MFLEMNRARAGPLLSVAVALCIACGHTETSMQLFLATGLYFVWGLYLSGQKRRLQALFSFVAWSAAGGLIAAVHLIPSQVYFSSSYVRFWRDPQFFSWRLLGNISRPLAAADAAWLALAAASAYGAVRFARSFFGRPPLSRSWPCEVRDLALTTLLAGLCAAALMNAGLEPLWGYQIKRHIAFPADYAGILAVPLGLAALASGRVCPRLKGLGLIYVFAFLVEHKAPGLCHLLGRVPYVGMGFFYFNGDVLTFTATALAGAGLDALLALSGQAHESRRQLFLRFSSGLLALLACLSLAPGLARLTARALPLGLVSDFALDRQNPSLGGITDPGSRSITWSRYTVRGWGPPDIRQVLVGVLSGSRTLVTPARLTRRSDKTYFEGSVPLDKGSSVIALVDDAAGRRTPIHGPEIVYDTQALLSRSDWLIFAGAVAIVLLAIASPLPKAALIVAVALAAGWDLAPLAMRQYESTPMKLAFPSNAPTLGPILRDKGLFRIDTFGGKGWHDEDIFRPESPLDYGISDFRNRDASDVMAFKNFFWLVQDAAQAGGSAAARLLGLANVKYVLASVRTPMPRDDFELVMADKSVELYRNKRFLPRALFFTNALFLPGMDNAADDLAGGKKLAAQILWLMSHGGLDPASDLLIDASGPTTEPDGSKTASPIPASIVSYAPHRVEVKVQAPAAGWVFLSDTYFPGWEAAVDGTPAEILRAWVMFRAVAVPPGSHTIVFTYRPLGLWIGAVISLAFAFLILALWAFARRAPASSFSSACVLAETLLIASFAGLLVFWIGWWLWSCH